MEDECLCNPLNWEFYCQQETLEDLKYSVLQTTMELESTIITAKEEITRRECALIHLNDLLNKVMKERDESQAQCHKLMLEKQELVLQQNHQTLQIHEDESQKQRCADSSNSSASETERKTKKTKKKKKGLPEKGKLLKAVMEAGPLLHTLLMAGGPLPQWRHPPPPLHSIQTPPFMLSKSLN